MSGFELNPEPLPDYQSFWTRTHTQLAQMFKMYRSQFSFNFNVDVLDNALLSIICEYGVFSLFFIKTLLSPTLDSYYTIKRNKQLLKAFWILNMSVFLLSFSFNITSYYSLVILYTSIVISLYHCSLQYNSIEKKTGY